MSSHYNKIENVLTPLANSLLKVLLRIAQVDLRWRRLGEEGLVKHVRSKFRSLLKPTVQMRAFIRCGFLSRHTGLSPENFKEFSGGYSLQPQSCLTVSSLPAVPD